MGEEIKSSVFRKKDYKAFVRRFEQEMQLLHSWFLDGGFSHQAAIAGFEQEAWLIDKNALPMPINEAFLQAAQNDLLSPELARFNIELNVDPAPLEGKVFSTMLTQFQTLWQQCAQLAESMQARMIMTGILPTVRDQELNLKNMSAMNRYRALNESVMQARKGRPLNLDIVGHEHLQSQHYDVMLESAATSFQIHRQVPFNKARRYYNASIIASAPLVALSANSPYLFGKYLWEETRIPLFEQAVEIGGYGGAGQGPVRRVGFGSGYVEESLWECFVENRDHFPVLLPEDLGDDVRKLAHVRLHNGTIWRWNRPLIGFDADGSPHLRIEQRVASAGPTVIDEIANAAFFYGLQEALATAELAPEIQLEFATARDNFYQAARHGLQAHVRWLQDSHGNMQRLLLEKLIPLAEQGLDRLSVNANDKKDLLDIIRARVSTARTGAAWQKGFAEKHNRDMHLLTEAYLANQNQGAPVHEWTY